MNNRHLVALRGMLFSLLVLTTALPLNLSYALPPNPEIRANGADGTLNLITGERLSVTIQLDAGSHSGESADWWVVAETPFGWFHYDYDNSGGSWLPGFSVSHRGPLFNLNSIEVLNISGLPSGTYTLYLGIDLIMNSSLDYGHLYYDSIAVNYGQAGGTIGPAGGTIEITAASSALYGTRIVIPEGALEREVFISVSPLPGEDLELQNRQLPSTMRFAGGIRIDSGGVTLNKEIAIFIPNSIGASADDQLLVGEVVKVPMDIPTIFYIYKGTAHAGSPIHFAVSTFGQFGVLAPTAPLGLVGGTLVTKTDLPVSNGYIGTSYSNPFVAITNRDGYFEIPAGPAGSYTAIVGMPRQDLVPSGPTGGVGIRGFQVPTPIPTPPTSLIDPAIRVIMETLDLPEPPIPPPCSCDPIIPPTFLSREEPHQPPFELNIGDTIRTFLLGPEGVYSGCIPPQVFDPAGFFKALFAGKVCTNTDLLFYTENPEIASVDPQSGLLTARRPGTTVLHARLKGACFKQCPLGTLPCPYDIEAIPAPVTVRCTGSQCPSYVIVHAHNPEGVEIASIGGMRQNSVTIYDGDALIGYGAYNAEAHNKPIGISAGTHTIKAKFNGMTKEQSLTLNPNEIKVITFIFSRIDRDYNEMFDYSKVESIEYQTEGEVYPSPGGLYSANCSVGWGPMCWIGVCNLLSSNRSLTYQWIHYNMSGGAQVTWERIGNHLTVLGEFHAEVVWGIPMDIMFSLEVNNFYRSQFYSGFVRKSITPYYGFDYFFVQRYNPSPYYYALDYFNASETTMSIGYPNGEGGGGDQENLYNQSSRSFVQSKILHDWYEPWAQAVVSNVPYDLTGTGVKDG